LPRHSCFQSLVRNRAVSDAVLGTFVTLYALVIAGSVVGNGLVIAAVLRAPAMRKVSDHE